MRQSHLIVSNAAVMWLTRILLLFPQIILVPFLIHGIGESGYGVYALVWPLMVSIDQLQKSLQSGVVKYSAAFLAQQRIDEVNKVVSSSFVYSLVLAVVASAGILVAASLYDDPSGQIGSSLVVVGVMILLTIPLTPYVAVIQSRQRYYVEAITETLSRYISLLTVVVWFHIVGPSVQAPIVIMAGMLFLSRLCQVPVAYRLVSGLRINPSGFDAASFRLIASFGAAIVLASLCLVANTTGVRWMMGILVSASFVAHLAIVLMPCMLLSQAVSAITITVMPTTSACEATGNKQMLVEILIRGIRYSTVLVLIGLLAAGLLMRDVLSLWVGSEYAFLAPYAIALFASGAFMESTSTAHHMLKGLGKLRAIVLIYLFGLVIVPISTILTVYAIWRDPYVAATSGLALGHLVCGCLQVAFCMKAVHADDWGGLFKRAYAQPLVVFVSTATVVLCFTAFIASDGLIGKMFVAVLIILLSIGASYLFIATSGERQQIKEMAQFALSKIAAIRARHSAPQGQ